ncbi:glycoside hydrolase family 88 protein [Lacimicrobium alkaliphilum]|uniref:Peptidase S8/S53 domain-containing protein n=1 Tax=Lacimicrobium alkaliphilum TaxID=1526571 RepID=A0ABQ1R6R5_9ALTE|nr:glycoside hydrolase family 88 protein [Lacimicrobium alkaliphilum]GGD60365.1 hypothetical protein GCM10011357_14510 [Lacimicrobium alkaliphilum]
MIKFGIGAVVSLLVIVGSCKADSFSSAQAKANLDFALSQYVKMMEQVENKKHLKLPEICRQALSLCTPRALHQSEIQIEVPGKWTNGFYPGVFWKLLSVGSELSGMDETLEQQLFSHAVAHQQRLYPEAWRTDTHDLGFIVYDSFAEALAYKDLPELLRHRYRKALQQASASLYQRYMADYGVIRSWDWPSAIKFPVQSEQGIKQQAFELARPWQMPVIIDNMMNLELLLNSSEREHQQAAMSHGLQTLDNHYYTTTSSGEALTLAYHLYDYALKMPGNWQGLGNHSIWSRGQGWSLYGFATLLEQQPSSTLSDQQHALFLRHTQKLVDTLDVLLSQQPVPDWDLIAAQKDAADYVTDSKGLAYSPMQDLCPDQVDKTILPYRGYRPFRLDTALLKDSAKKQIMGLNSSAGEPLRAKEGFYPCGRDTTERNTGQIPKDSSAAAVLASALYRLALNPAWPEKQRVVVLADAIMSELTSNYLSQQNTASAAYHRGFVLTSATGNMPAASEIDTGIIYADFYFIEANQLKLNLQ